MSVIVPATITCCAVFIAALEESAIQLAAVTFFLAAIGWPWVSQRRTRTVLLWTAPFAVPLLLIHGLLNPAFSTSWHVGGIPVRISGLQYAAIVTLRLTLIAVAAVSWRGVNRTQLLALARALHVPATMTLALVAASSAIAIMETRVRSVVIAQQARGLSMGPGLRQRFVALITIAVPIITTTIIDAHHRGSVVTVRGLGSATLASPSSLIVERRDWIRATAGAFATIGVIFWR